MTTTPTPEWETFNDPSYYDMWCVRQIGQRTFGEGFHLVNGDEARLLCNLLNTRTAPTPEQVARPPEVEALVEALERIANEGGETYDNWLDHGCDPKDAIRAIDDLARIACQALAQMGDG